MPYAWSLVVFFFCSLIHLFMFISCPLEYLTRGTAQLFIPMMRFLLERVVSSSFLVLRRYSFWIFSFISTCLMMSPSKIPKYFKVSFSPSFLILYSFGSSFRLSYVVCHFLLQAWPIFQCQIPFLCLDCIF